MIGNILGRRWNDKVPTGCRSVSTQSRDALDWNKEILQVGRFKVTDSLVSKHPDLEFNSLHDWQPMKFVMQYMLNRIIS